MMDGFFYLATPYSKYPEGIEEAFRLACRATAKLIRAGVRVYSPIAHTHPVAIHGGLDPFDHATWLPADRPFMEAARALVVLMADGWRESVGIAEEIRIFHESGKPVIYMDVRGPIPAELLP
jgi:Domain of unknown function (DUF1937)